MTISDDCSDLMLYFQFSCLLFRQFRHIRQMHSATYLLVTFFIQLFQTFLLASRFLRFWRFYCVLNVF